MKKGFTLVEMLIVVVVLVTLMSITFRLSSLGDDQTRRSATISRLQRLENCLSGYYAAFGTYPPVKNHGYKDFRQVNSKGFQKGDEATLNLGWYKPDGNHGIGTSEEYADWKIVRAVCQNQPVACRFPYPEGYNPLIEAQAKMAQERVSNGEDTNTDPEHLQSVSKGWDDGYTNGAGRHNLGESNWQESQLFQFGLMSHLLPRYLMMMSSGTLADQFYTQGRQWLENNALPCDPFTGERMTDWMSLKGDMAGVISGGASSGQNYQRISMIASQAVCARWIPNLENSCYSAINFNFYGIFIKDESQTRLNSDYGVFSPGGSEQSGTDQQYVLGAVTMTDGWHNELYYYSPPPYQSYILWSAGPNERTYPPWMSRKGLSQMQNQCVSAWINDDIINMSN